MPIPATAPITSDKPGRSSYLLPFILVTSLFFLWGLANSLNGTLIKHFQTALGLNRAKAGIVDSAFYVGYFVMALPAAFLMNRIGYKKGIIIGLLMYAVGALLFYPSAEMRVYGFFLASLFIIACGLAFLETAANPYVTALGDPSKSISRINFAQSFNGLSTILGPIIGSLFIFSSKEYTNEMLDALPANQAEAIRIEEAHSVQTPYLVVAAVVLMVAVLFSLTRMPAVETKEESRASLRGITRHRHLLLGIVAQFFYVGAQASIWGYFVDLKLFFSKSEQLKIVQWIYPVSSDMTPTQIAGFHASFAFVIFMVGRFAGTWLLTKIKANRLLSCYAAACLVLLVFSYFGSGLQAVVCLMLIYFFMSIMFPTIFSLSIRGLGPQVKIGSGLVIMAIVGGGVLPPLAGWLSLGRIQNALIVPFVGFAVILYFGLKGYEVKKS